MAIRPDWTIGKLTLSAGTKNFTTVGSALLQAQVQAGDEIITAPGDILIIEAITGDNAGTLYHPCPVASAGLEQPLRIRFQPDGSRYSAAARDLIEQLGNGNLYAFSQLLGGVDKVPYFTGAGVMDLIDLSSLGGGGAGGGSWDALTGTLAGRDAFNGEAAGFRVLVANNGNGQAVIYQKTGPAAANWSTPIPFTGAKGNDGQPNTLTVGSVTEGEQAHVSITGTSPNQIVNFVLRRGAIGPMGDVTPEALAAKAAAEAAADAAAQDAVRTAGDRIATGQDKTATAADRVVTTADKQATGQDKAATAADRIATGQDRVTTTADRQATAADKISTSANAATATTKAAEAVSNAALTAADRVATGQDKTATASDKTATAADRVVTGQDRAVTGADKTATAASALTAAGSATSANNSKVDAQAAAIVSDERATVSTTGAATSTTQAGIATAAATQVTADKATVATDKAIVAADKAIVSTNTAATVAARDKAQLWANAPQGQAIEAGQYSAYHWSKIAETAAGGGVQIVNGKTGAEITLDAADVGAAPVDHSHADATPAAAGFMSAADKSKLENIPSNADKTNTTSVGAALAAPTPATELVDGDKVGGVGAGGALLKTWSWATIKAGIKLFTDTLYASKGQGTKADTALQTLLEGSNISIAGSGSSRTISARGVQSVNNKTDAAITLTAPDVGAAPTNHSHADATTAAAGFMSVADKTKLENIPSNADKTNTTSVGAALAAPTPSTAIQDGDKVAGILSGGATLATWSWGSVKAWIKGWITKADVGLALVDNTSDANKPISTQQQTALNLKLDKDAQAADSAKLGNETAAQWQGKFDTKVSSSRITISVASPSGGVNGDVWFKL